MSFKKLLDIISQHFANLKIDNKIINHIEMLNRA